MYRYAPGRLELGVHDFGRYFRKVDDGDARWCCVPLMRHDFGGLHVACISCEEVCEVSCSREMRARVGSDELRSGLPVKLKELRRVMVTPREETIPETRVRELSVLLSDLVTSRGVVPTTPAAVRDEVDGSHSLNGAVSSEESCNARRVERELRFLQGIMDDLLGASGEFGERREGDRRYDWQMDVG